VSVALAPAALAQATVSPEAFGLDSTRATVVSPTPLANPTTPAPANVSSVTASGVVTATTLHAAVSTNQAQASVAGLNTPECCCRSSAPSPPAARRPPPAWLTGSETVNAIDFQPSGGTHTYIASATCGPWASPVPVASGKGLLLGLGLVGSVGVGYRAVSTRRHR
jgi:hypothetical protein